jgi:hypothetical protein
MRRNEVLLRLAREIEAFHSQTEQGRVTVLPIIVDELTDTRVVIRMLSELSNGRLFMWDDGDIQGPVPQTAGSLVMKPAVETALSTVPSGGSRRVELVQPTPGVIDAVFVDPPAGPDPSPGEKTVLAIARAVMHSDLDTSELAIISWRDAIVDLRLRSALWRLGVEQLTDMPHPTLRTLIMVVESTIDIGLHCQTGRGFRFAVEGGRLLRRHGKDDLAATAWQVANHPKPFVLFLGAGFSASSRLPLGNSLRDQAIRTLMNIDPTTPMTSQQLARRFYDFVSSREGWLTPQESAMGAESYVQDLTLEQVVRAEKRLHPDLPTLQSFRVHHDSVVGVPGSAVTELASILRLLGGQVILVEVNFDLLVETHSGVPLRVFSSEADFASAAEYLRRYLNHEETAVPLLKLHGTIDVPDTCVISDDQTELGVGSNKLNALRTLLDEADPRLWIYIGASMRDRDLLRVFSDEDWARGVDEFWVSPFLPDTVERFALLREPFWRGRDFRHIDDRLVSETADAFFAALRKAVEKRDPGTTVR